MTASISRTFALWASGLRYEDLPPEVVDKIKAIILLAGHSALLGCQEDSSRNLVSLVEREDGKADGATIVTTGKRVARQAAALADAKIMEASGMWDSYRMITHPAAALVSAGLVNAELEGRSGRDLITALAAGYEFTCRLAYDYVPSVAARGFRPAPIFAVMGASLISGKLIGLDADGLVSAIAIAANGAAGLNESGRSGGTDMSLHDPLAARHGVFAAIAASTLPGKASEQVIEGDAGFLRAYAGSSTGELTYTFEGPRKIDIGSITKELGSVYKLLTVMFRVYNTAGYNQPVIELMSELKQQHDLRPEDIAEVAVHMNYLENLYPSPEFPRHPDWQTPRTDTTHFYAACAAVRGFYPQVGQTSGGAHRSHFSDDPEVLAFLKTKVRLVPRYDYPMFSPSITVGLNDGSQISGYYPYERMTWNFEQVAQRLQRSRAGLAGREKQADKWVEVIHQLDQLTSMQPLLETLQGVG